jgi:hypothetical protein
VLAEELQLAGLVQLLQLFEEAPPEQPATARAPAGRTPAGTPPRLAVGCQTAAGHDAVYMRVVRQRRAPGVQHQRRADACAQVLGVGGDGLQYLGGHIEQQPIHRGLVLVREVGDGRRQREDHVVILDRQQIGLPGVEPALGRRALALRAVPVAAGVVGDLIGAAAFAAQHMSHPAPPCGTGSMADITLSWPRLRWPRCSSRQAGPMFTEDVGDLQGGPPHGLPHDEGGNSSSGPITSRSRSVATWA